MNDLIRVENTPEGQRALALHYEIKTTLEQVATGMVNFCRQLKTMRDEKLYLHIGFDTFEDYVEKSHGIKQRQRYTYISTLEKLGARLMEEQSGIGITKLQLLTQISAPRRDEFAEENDLANISVTELQKLIEEKNGISQQLALFESESRRKTMERDELIARINRLKEQLEEKDQLDFESAQPMETAGIDTELAEKIRREAFRQRQAEKEKEIRRLKARQEKELKEEKKKHREAMKAEKDKISVTVETEKRAAVRRAKLQWTEESNSRLTAEIEKANRRAARLEKQLEIKSDDTLVKFGILFENLQIVLSDCDEIIKEISETDSEKADKLRKAIKTAFGAVTEE